MERAHWAQGRVREDPKEFKVHPDADPLGTSHGRRYHRDQLSMSLVHVVLAHYAAGLRALVSGSLASVGTEFGIVPSDALCVFSSAG